MIVYSTEEEMVSVIEYGAAGNGRKDDFLAVQKALGREKEIFFPSGTYIVSDTIKVPSDRKLVFEKGASLKLRAVSPRKRGDFLLTNEDIYGGNENITIIGATFDGNNEFRYHKRPNDIFKKDGYSGILVNFCNVKNLTLSDITLKDPVAYYTRFCKVDGFLIENITLISKKIKPNQDGIHFAGKVKNGVVKNVKAESWGQTNDDLLALNADDFMGRIEEFDTECGEIENVTFEDIYAESCHDAVRLLSYRSAIRNITFKNLKIGFRVKAIDCNAARGCRAELFKEEDEPNGVGQVENVTFEDCVFWHTKKYPIFWKGSFGGFPHPFVCWGSNADGVKIKNCRFVDAPPLPDRTVPSLLNVVKFDKKSFPAFSAKNITKSEIIADGKTYRIEKKEDVVTLSDFQDLEIISTRER